jgi:penicillin-binding protein 2
VIEILPKDRKRFRKLLEESKTFESLPIRTRLSEEEVARFAANRYLFPGVEVKARLFRQYPLGRSASHAIGYINRINKRDLEMIEESEQAANYKGTDHIGKTGLEQKYEFQLHGETGYEQVEIDAGGRAVRSLSRTAPGAGQQSDADARHQAAGDGRKGFWRPPRRAGGDRAVDRRHSGAGVDADLRPQSVHRRHPQRRLGSAQQFARQALAQPGTQRRLSAGFDLQAVHGAGGAGKRQAHGGQTISDPGFFNFGGHHFRDDKKGGHGRSTCTSRSFSPATPTTTCWPTTWGSTIARFMGQLGFGQRTGVDIEGESEGVLPSPEWKKRVSSGRSSRSGLPVKRSRSASARATTLHADPAGAGDGHLANNGVMFGRTSSSTSPTAAAARRR